jgi:hypothetical protein
MREPIKKSNEHGVLVQFIIALLQFLVKSCFTTLSSVAAAVLIAIYAYADLKGIMLNPAYLFWGLLSCGTTYSIDQIYKRFFWSDQSDKDVSCLVNKH